MSSATLTYPPTATARLVVDTDVASFIFKWHPEFAPRYMRLIRGAELVVSFMTLAEMRQGALDANWGPRKSEVLEAYFAEFFHLAFGQPPVFQIIPDGPRFETRAHAKGAQ